MRTSTQNVFANTVATIFYCQKLISSLQKILNSILDYVLSEKYHMTLINTLTTIEYSIKAIVLEMLRSLRS